MDAVASISEKVGDLGDYLREQREGAKLSVRQLATLAGVSNPYLSQIERGLRKPSAEVLQQIAKGLRISAEALYVRAGILDGEGRPDVEAAIGADPALTDRQRRALLDIYTSFCAENARVGLDAAPPARRPLARRMSRTATSKASATKASAAEAATTKTPAAKTATAKRATVKSVTVKSVTAKPVTAKPVTAKSSATKTPATKRAATTRAASKTAAKKATTKAGAPKTSRTAKTQQNPSSDG